MVGAPEKCPNCENDEFIEHEHSEFSEYECAKCGKRWWDSWYENEWVEVK